MNGLVKYVCVILCGLSLLSCGVAEKKLQEAKEERARGEMENTLATALKGYQIFAGQYPTEDQGLAALVEKPEVEPLPKRWVKQLKWLPKDPWGRDYVYRRTENKLILRSKGKDEKDSSDDIIHTIPLEEE